MNTILSLAVRIWDAVAINIIGSASYTQHMLVMSISAPTPERRAIDVSQWNFILTNLETNTKAEFLKGSMIQKK